MNEIGQKLTKTLKRVLLIAAIIGLAILSFYYFGNYSSGERVGKVIKLSQRGVVFKTWEGQLGMESFGAVNSRNQFSQTFEFSVAGKNDEVLANLKTAMTENRRVSLHYVEKYWILPWRGDTEYLITKVDLLEKSSDDDDSDF